MGLWISVPIDEYADHIAAQASGAALCDRRFTAVYPGFTALLKLRFRVITWSGARCAIAGACHFWRISAHA